MKKLLSVLLAAFMLVLAMPVSAADLTLGDLPYITCEDVGYIDYTGSDDASGASASSAKKTFGTARASGVVGLLANGGTMVVSGKAYLSKSYSLPKLKSPLLITSKYADVNYMNAEPASNPACAFKMASGAQFTVQSDVIIDDIVLFQEHADANAFVVTNGATLVIGDGVVSMSKSGTKMQIIVESGSRAIIAGGDFDVINNGGEVVEDYTYEYLKVSQTAAPEEDNSELINVPPAVAYISYNGGKNANDGLTPATAKKQMLELTSNGALSVVAGGGTLVATGRLYIGSDYTIPKLGSQLTITGVYDGVNYVNAENESNPESGMLKMLSGKTLTIQGDVRFENIILFQENSQNTIKVVNGGTLTIGENVIFMTKQLYTMKIEVEQGGTVIFETAEHGFDAITGDGIVIMPETEKGGFTKTRAYDGRFTDVTTEKWFYDYVKTAYEYELANGTSATKFSPDNKFTVAQALTAAANIHTAYYGKSVPAAKAGESWYTPYVNYCLDNGIIVVGQFADYNKNITRGEMATVFANILPADEYEATRNGTCPDVTSSMACYAAVTKLYNAGIVGGDAKTGNYRPNDEIVRSEACVIFTRIAATEYRAK
ncbi:MAG: S-layer homology domain-containing protein [Clostridia bacterium]|nr:S-layer homology domain-containing protein [Clostridia bacterium]